MPLPKIDAPTFTIKMPYSGTTVEYRPFTVKEEKILLFAQQARDPKQIAHAIKQVISNCITNDVDLGDLYTFEVDYFFIKLRAVSVNNVIKLKLRDGAEGEEAFYDVEVNLDDVQLTDVNKPKDADKIPLNDDYIIKLTYPRYKSVESIVSSLNEENAGELTFRLIGECIESIFSKDGEEVYIMKDYTDLEKKEFLDSLTSKNFKDIQEYINDIPALQHEVQFIDAEKKVRSRVLRGLFDFFTFA